MMNSQRIGGDRGLPEGGQEYQFEVKGGRTKQYIKSAAGVVLESLQKVERKEFSLSVGDRKYIIPVGIDYLNLDDRKYSGNDRGLFFYVKGNPQISKKVLGKKYDETLPERAEIEFEEFLIAALKEVQGGQADEIYEVLRAFEIHN